MQDRAGLDDVIAKEVDDPMNGRVGVYVFDLDRQQELISHAADDEFPLASLTKVFTVGAALEHLGSDATFTTRIVAAAPVGDDGTLDGDLFIVGGGDLTLGTAEHIQKRYGGRGTHVDQIAEQVSRAGIRRVTGQLVGNGALFSPSGARSTRWITALPFNRTRDEQPVLTTAQAVAEALSRTGITVEGGAAEGDVPAGTAEIGTVASPTVHELAIVAGHESDNFVAEGRTKHIAAQAGADAAGSTDEGCTVIEDYAAELGAEVTLFNGSGLRVPRAGALMGNSGTPRAVGTYMRAMAEHRNRHLFEATLPRAATEGTLTTRMRNTSAVGRVRAKTGTLTHERKPLQDSLAGYCTGAGTSLAYVLMYERAESRFVARSSLDRVMAVLADYCETSVP